MGCDYYVITQTRIAYKDAEGTVKKAIEQERDSKLPQH
jgi:hypothetical protein